MITPVCPPHLSPPRRSRCGVLLGTALSLGLLGVGAAQAAVEQSAEDGFLVVHTIITRVSPLHAYLAITQPSKWWLADHTWSGSAANLTLEARPGGCFCETWKGGGVQHMRVVWVTPPSELRLEGSLGPLQSMGLSGLLRFEIAPQDAGSSVRLSYRVSGDSLQSLTALAPAVDGVLGAQLGSLQRLLNAPAGEPPVTARGNTN